VVPFEGITVRSFTIVVTDNHDSSHVVYLDFRDARKP